MFTQFRQKVQERLDLIMSMDTVLVMDVERDAANEAYLAAFPEEYRQEHNCSCCRHFLRDYAHIVGVKDGVIHTVWDFEYADGVYDAIPAALHKLISKAKPRDYFVTKDRQFGVEYNLQYKDGQAISWDHFYYENNRVSSLPCSIEAERGSMKSTRNVFERSLNELSQDAMEIVLELILQGSLYRGDEYKSWVQKVLAHKKAYDKLKTKKAKSLYAWEHAKDGGKIRNSAIGTLLIDLSEDVDLETAVKRYENVVAPSNYKRPKALATKGMIEAAEKKVVELGYMDSLARRHATPDDIPVDYVLHVNRDNSVGSKETGSVFEQMKEDLPVNSRKLGKVEEVTFETFKEKILPTAKSIEVLLENKHQSNLMSVIAPTNKGSKSLFNWDNGLSWDYKGNVADSMKERVKAAGGKVDGELRISLEWFNYDDLDLHVIDPTGYEIMFNSKHCRATGGKLDVDMNAGMGDTRTPVENVIYPSSNKRMEGRYKVVVNNFCKRESKDVGFNVEIECQGEVYNFSHTEAVRDRGNVTVAEFEYSQENGVKLLTGDASSATISTEVWGMATNQWQKASMVMLSPNYWDTSTGNKHVFFILDKAQNDEVARGFYNEFLKPELTQHRKVFEMLGGKMQVADSHKQVSGLGFSSTKRADLLVKVEGSFSRIVKVKF